MSLGYTRYYPTFFGKGLVVEGDELTPEQREWVERHMPPRQSFPVFRSEFASNRPPAWQWPNVPSARGPESA